MIRIDATGALTLVQDAGRFGYAHLGVPRAGAFDRHAWRLANRLVGNSESEAVLESLGGGLQLTATTHLTVAVTGATGDVLLDRRPRDPNTPLHLAPGAQLALGPPRVGIRYYVAVGGGIRVPPVLGSRSHDTLGGLGPADLRPGSELPTGPPLGRPSVDHAAPRRIAQTFEVHPGPDAAGRLLEQFLDRRWDLDPQSNRVGVRLAGEPLEVDGRTLPSKPMVLGAVQLPPNGLPIILGPDHPTTGGYPVIAVITGKSMDEVAQWSGGIRQMVLA